MTYRLIDDFLCEFTLGTLASHLLEQRALLFARNEAQSFSSLRRTFLKRSLNEQIRACDKALDQLGDLNQGSFDPNQYQYFYTTKDDLTDCRLLLLSLEKMQDKYRNLAKDMDALVPLRSPATNPEKLSRIVEVMRQTEVGKRTADFLEERQIPILFVPVIYKARVLGKAAAVYNPGKKDVYIGENGVLEKQADILIHELTHAEQDLLCPEFFSIGAEPGSPEQELVDAYVATHLAEAGAYAAGILSDEQKKDPDFYEKEKEISPFTDLPVGNYSAAIFVMLFLQGDKVWKGYDEKHSVACTIATERPDDFKKMLSQSQFLERQFLDKFCVDSMGYRFINDENARLLRAIITEALKRPSFAPGKNIEPEVLKLQIQQPAP